MTTFILFSFPEENGQKMAIMCGIVGMSELATAVNGSSFPAAG